MKRRTFLASCGLLVGSGCIGGSEQTTSEPDPGTEPGTTTLKSTNSGSSDELSLGETYTSETGVEITAEQLETRSSLQYSSSATGENETLTPSEGENYALVYVSAENTSDEPQSLPWLATFDVLADGAQAGATRTFKGGMYTLNSLTVEYEEWYEPVEDAHPGVTASGWLVFPGIPDVDRTECRVAWTEDPESVTETEPETAYWSP